MKSESQLSTYMNHMVPPPRPPPDRRDGPARLGSGNTEPPPPSPRPRPADGGTAVRRRREQPGRSAPLGRIRTSAARRRGGPAAAGRVLHPARGAPATRGCTQGRAREAARGRGRGACRRDSVPGTPWVLRRQRGGGRGARGPPDRCPALSGRKASGGSPTRLVLLRRLTGTKLLRPNAGQAPCKRLLGIFVMDVDCKSFQDGEAGAKEGYLASGLTSRKRHRQELGRLSSVILRRNSPVRLSSFRVPSAPLYRLHIAKGGHAGRPLGTECIYYTNEPY